MNLFYYKMMFLINSCLADYSFYFQPPSEPSQEKAYEKLRIFEDKFQETLENLVQKVTPTIINLGYEANITRECSSSLMKLMLDFKDMKTWAFLMLDASGKQEGGFMSGSFGSFGNYKQCLDIEEKMDHRVIAGKYCLADIKPPLPPKPKQLALKQEILTSNLSFKTQLMKNVSTWLFAFYDLSMRFGICIPSQCSKDDLTDILTKLLNPFKLNTGVISCEVKENMIIDNMQYAIISILVVIFGINVLCTVAYFVKLKDNLNSNERNLMSIDKIVSDILFEAIGSGFLAVDTFIFIGGTVVAYGAIKQIGKRRFGSKEALILSLCRIWRILPCLFVLIGLTLLLPLIGSGPMWKDYTEGIANNCRKSWWANILFINNYYNNLYDMCLSHTWYLSVDFQCFIFGIIYLLLYFKYPKISKAYTCALITICTSLTGFVTYYNEYPPTILIKKSIFIDYRYGVQYMALSYISTHVHLGVYCVGLLTGTYLAKSNKITLPSIMVRLCWCVSLIAGLSIVYGIHHWNEDKAYTRIEAMTYSSLQRIVWAIILCWLSLACVTGNGGMVKEFLAWSGFRPLARLSFLVYLVHYLVIIGYVATGQGLSDYSHSRFVFIFFGILCVSHILAFALNILIESPLIQVTKIIYEDLIGCNSRRENNQGSKGEIKNWKIEDENREKKIKNNDIVDFEPDNSGRQITRF